MTVQPTLYEFAGGREAVHRLAELHYGRCLADPLLVDVFGTHGDAAHVEHLADWMTEVLGGPKLYSERHGGHVALLRRHAGRRIGEPQRERFVACFMDSVAEAGMPDDPAFRARMLSYVEWGSRIALDVSQRDEQPQSSEPVPVWGWGDEAPPARA